jgi:alpha-ketoglutarate-dependent taurine dioxygenase
MSSSLLAADIQPGKPPLVEAASVAGLSWEQYRDGLRAIVAQYGSVRVRGLGLADANAVGDTFRGLASSLMIEREAFAERKVYAEGIYGSSNWPANQPMCMHHELSYSYEFPTLMMFACLKAPTSGGVTGVADSPSVLAALPQDLVSRLEAEGWWLIRSYNEDIGAAWEDSFGTSDRGAVEAYCNGNGIQFEWQSDGGLKTRQHRAAVVVHPVTGQRCWFNQVAFLNEYTMAPEVREYLVDVYGSDGLPFNTRFGNGDPLPEDIVETVNAVYEAHTLREPWQAGDLMLVDNIRATHSRDPYEGDREILVGLGDPVRLGG